jgi:hypothetical protein
MSNVLDGVQFRTTLPSFPSWNDKEGDRYSDWCDCDNVTQFPSGTEFRLKPDYVYTVGSAGLEGQTYNDKTTAMAEVSRRIDAGEIVKLSKDLKVNKSLNEFLMSKNIQYKMGSEGDWTMPKHFGGSIQGCSITWRVRPDTYFVVKVSSGISMSELSFYDVDKLNKYVSNQLRTSENNISITRRRYDEGAFVATIKFG